MTTIKQEAAKEKGSKTKVEFAVGPHKVTATTKLKYKANPKRKNSQAWARYEAYQKAKTFAQYQKLNDSKQQIADLKYDLERHFVEIVS